MGWIALVAAAVGYLIGGLAGGAWALIIVVGIAFPLAYRSEPHER